MGESPQLSREFEIEKINWVEKKLCKIKVDLQLKMIALPDLIKTIVAERELIRNLDLENLDLLLGKQLMKIKRIAGHYNYLVHSTKSEFSYNPKFSPKSSRLHEVSKKSLIPVRSKEPEITEDVLHLETLKKEYYKLKSTYFEALRAGFLLNRIQVG